MKWTAPMLALGLLACDKATQTETCATGEVQSWLISELTFARRDAGIVEGFDLDGTSAATCGHADLSSPGGDDGVDNNFSAIVPILEATEAVAAESLIKQSIASGELMLTVELDGLESWEQDSCLDFTLGRAGGVPLVGPDGVVLADQTLEPHDIVGPVTVPASAAGGDVEARGLSFNLPMDILNAELDFVVTDGAFRVWIGQDGNLHGVMGGQIPVRQITEILERDDVNLQEFVPVVEAIADVQDDEGRCSGLSLAFEFTAIPVYLRRDLADD